MGRPRIHQDQAARQRAYRARQREREARRRQAQAEGAVLATTPFHVVDPAGRTVLRIVSEDDAALLVLHAPGGGTLQLIAAPAFRSLVLRNREGDAEVVIEGNEGGGMVELRNNASAEVRQLNPLGSRQFTRPE